MRHKEFLTSKQLDEVRMSPTALKKFADSPEAENIMAGFEAELYFRDVIHDHSDWDYEMDMDRDEIADDIDEICNFFANDDGGNNTRRVIDRMRGSMQDSYYEWRDDQLGDQWDEDGQSYLTNYIHQTTNDEDIAELRGEEYDGETTYSKDDCVLAAQNSWEAEDEYYDAAHEAFDEDYGDNYPEQDWLRSEGITHMSDVPNQGYDVSWPYYHEPERNRGFDDDIAENFAEHLADYLGVKAKVHHGEEKLDDTWYFESDGSLDSPDDEDTDMPCEITSPPMPIKECLAMLDKFYQWCDANDAYTNSSTGFHMGLSLKLPEGMIPGETSHANVDYIKLVLFLGDIHVLEKFDRLGKQWCKPAIEKIKDRLIGTGERSEKVEHAFNLVGHNLIELAQKSLGMDSAGFREKYTSVNPHTSTKRNRKNFVKYIEFRSAGGDYLEELEKIKNTLQRYAKALMIASDPSAEREEYAKKLTKLLVTGLGKDPVMDLFARYQAGSITRTEFKKEWGKLATNKDLNGPISKRDLARKEIAQRIEQNPHALNGKWYEYEASAGWSKVRVIANSYQEALILAKMNLSSLVQRNIEPARITLTPLRPVEEPKAAEPETDDTTEWDVIRLATGEKVGRFKAKNQEEAEEHKFRTLQNAGLTPGNYGILPADQSSYSHSQDQNDWGAGTMWEIYKRDNGRVMQSFTTATEDRQEAVRKALLWLRSHGITDPTDTVLLDVRIHNPDEELVLYNPNDFQQRISQASNTWTGYWLIKDSDTGQVLHRIHGIGNAQADANRHAAAWLRTQRPDANMTEIEVVPEMGQ